MSESIISKLKDYLYLEASRSEQFQMSSQNYEYWDGQKNAFLEVLEKLKELQESDNT